MAAVDEKFQEEPDDDRTIGNQTQKLHNPDAWATAELHDSWSDPSKSIDIKLQEAADFIAKARVRSPSESTAKWWLAMVLALHCQNWLANVQDYQRVFRHPQGEHRRKSEAVALCSYLQL